MKVYSRSRVVVAAALGVAALMAGAVPLAAQAAGATATRADRAQYILSYNAGAGASARAAVVAAGGRVVSEIEDMNALAVELPAAAVVQLRRHGSVEFIEIDPPRHAFAVRPRARTQDGPPSSTVAVVPYGIPMVQADQVSDSQASNRKLCIVDSGIDGAHEDLSGLSIDGTNLTTSGSWNTDELHHGTHVAGTIAAVNNTFGVIGVLPNRNLNLYISKVFDASNSASSSTIVRGMMACMRARANVVSMSLGGDSSSRLEQRAVSRLAARGILIIAAAGNNGTTSISYPAGFPEVVSVAAIDSSMAVADFSQKNSDVELSGPGVDVVSTVPMGKGIDTVVTVGGSPVTALPTDGPVGSASAPLADFGFGDVPDAGMAGKICLISRGNITFGEKVVNCQANGGVGAIIYNNTAGPLNATLGGAAVTIPSVTVTQADGATLLTKLGQTASITLTASNYAVFSGTSMATPHVSGVAALVWSYKTECTAEQIRAILTSTAQHLGDPGRNDAYGFGLVQAKAAKDHVANVGCN